MTYSEKLKDPRWQRKRLEIMERDDFTCRDCGSRDKTLHVHHCHYDKGEPWEARDDILLTLCADCHESRGVLESDAKLLLAQIMARLPNCPGDQEDLKEFVAGLAREAQRDADSFSPDVRNSFDCDWLEDIRWHQYAYANPEARHFYAEVTGYSLKWLAPFPKVAAT